MKACVVVSLAIPVLFAAAAPRSAGAQTVVPVRAFDQIELRGGGSVVVRHGPVQRVTLLEGSSQISRIEVVREGGSDRLNISPCEQRCPPRYRLRVEIVTPRLEAVTIKGGGTIVAQAGFPVQRNVAAAVHGGGSLDLRTLTANNVAASVSGGGSLLVRPQANLAASVLGGGRIRYWGNPSVTQAVRGGGSVSKAN